MHNDNINCFELLLAIGSTHAGWIFTAWDHLFRLKENVKKEGV